MTLNTLRSRPSTTGGFTLVEVIIAVAIVAVLATIALPSYREYVMRTNRTVAKVALQDLLTRQESYAVNHKAFATSFDRLGLSGSTAYVSSDGNISSSSTGALYQLSITGTNNTSTCGAGGTPGIGLIRIDAVRIAAGTDTRCGTLCITSSGDRGSSLGTVADCWRR